MTDERALAWLEAWAVDHIEARVILKMLARPPLSEEPTQAMLAVMRDALISNPLVAVGDVYARQRLIYAALRAELLKPATKTVERYHVESFVGGSLLISPIDRRDVADVVAGRYREEGRECVRVTGPHSHEVPG